LQVRALQEKGGAMNDILNLLPAFFAGMLTCAGLVILIGAKHLVPAIQARLRIQRRVSLVELLDAMTKLQLVDASQDVLLSTKYYEDDIDRLDPESAKLLKRMITDGN
jgi:hypothetical protein